VMASDWCAIYMLTAGPLLLGYFSDMTAVALYQVVVPAAALNTIVFQSFGMLFEPAASRLHARDDPEGMNHLYWRSAVWVAVLTFPLFALSFTAAVPITLLLFGERYVAARSEEHTSELQSRENLVCRLLLEKKNKNNI